MKYEDAVKRGRKILEAQANTPWELGDLALDLEPKYGESTLKNFADDLEIEFERAEQYRTVARAYGKPLRSGNLSWSVHRIFASQEDREELVKKKWTAKDARELVQQRSDDDKTDEELDQKVAAFGGMWKLILEASEAYYDDDRKEAFFQAMSESDLGRNLIEILTLEQE